MLSVLLVLSGVVGSTLAATTCSPAGAATGPCLNTLCPTGYTCTSDIQCCPTGNVVTLTTTTTTVKTTTAACVDLINAKTGSSDCPSMASYCTNSVYYTLMTTQCPKTCGRCSSSVTSTACVDQVNPSTGVSDCPSRTQYCTNSVYLTLMQQQCPKTCGFCSG